MAATSETETCPPNEKTEVTKDPCQICVNAACRYTCPRCNVRYCSVECYRCERHRSCSEAFYKECVIDGLKQSTCTIEERRNVAEMLERLNEDDEQDFDEEDVDDLECRISDLDLDRDTDEIWRRLTDVERSEFKTMLRDGRFSNLIDAWTPWWTNSHTKLIEDVTVTTISPTIPQSLDDVPDIHTLHPSPSPLIANSVIHVLFCYAYVTRLYNGSYWSCPVESVDEIMEICSVLKTNEAFSTPESAIHDVINTLNTESGSNRAFHISVIQDVRAIVSGPRRSPTITFIISALSDLHRLMSNAIKEIKKKKSEVSNDGAKSMSKGQKKLTFLLSWCAKYGAALHDIIPQLDREICAMSTDLASNEQEKQRIESVWRKEELDEKRGALIEEL